MSIANEGKQEEVRRRFHEGHESYDKLAIEYNVSPRTIQRWVNGQSKPRRTRVEKAMAVTLWPQDWLWPTEWGIDTLAAMPGLGDTPDFQRDTWEQNLAMIGELRTRGHLYRPAFFRRLVDIHQEHVVPSDAFDWLLGIASLPLLGYWLGLPDATNAIEKAMRDHRPWESKNARDAYTRDARDAVKQVNSQLELKQALNVELGMSRADRDTWIVFTALRLRIPEFDKRPRLFSRQFVFRSLKLDQILMGMFTIIDNGGLQ